MRAITALLILALIISCASRSDSKDSKPVLSIADPLEYGLDQEEIDQIEEHVQWAIDSAFISGAVALIAREDKIIYQRAFGFSDREKSKAMSLDNIFRFASMSKPITSTAVMQLIEQGKLSTDDPLSKFIPAFADVEVLETFNEKDSTFSTVPIEREITVHHLLTHTSGIPYSVFHPVAGAIYPQYDFVEAWTKDKRTLETNIPKQAKAPLMHQPGEAWTYGTNIDVLGYIVEKVSGMPLNQYFEENIFRPLDMHDTGFYLSDENAERLVDVWLTPKADENLPDLFVTDYPISGAKTYFAGGAGLVGTASDYLKFASAILNKGTLGEAQILKTATVDRMFANQIDTLRLDEGIGFGYGGEVRLTENEDGINIGQWGWDGYWQTYFRIDTQNDMVMILLTNAFNNPKWDEILGGFEMKVVQAIED
ncbi:serine hydrolase domain-containing protein [uncultured Maribacter sp.]|uniref:serine hydrolase domain-containing protein n=1 Tax=uncultured Maribacter sp. TaxID=431308 RepID=UPI0030D90DB5|tara:strand:- start:102 stop:1373 length:1272 start_codon:yes stop_codon:yes gene_type:complete